MKISRKEIAATFDIRHKKDSPGRRWSLKGGRNGEKI